MWWNGDATKCYKGCWKVDSPLENYGDILSWWYFDLVIFWFGDIFLWWYPDFVIFWFWLGYSKMAIFTSFVALSLLFMGRSGLEVEKCEKQIQRATVSLWRITHIYLLKSCSFQLAGSCYKYRWKAWSRRRNQIDWNRIYDHLAQNLITNCVEFV